MVLGRLEREQEALLDFLEAWVQRAEVLGALALAALTVAD